MFFYYKESPLTQSLFCYFVTYHC